MFRRQRQCGFDVGLCAIQILAGQGVHQIDVDVVEASRASLGESGQRVGAAVDAPQRRQTRVVEGLRAQRQPVDAGGAQRREVAALDRAGVGLQCDLGVCRQRQAHADAV